MSPHKYQPHAFVALLVAACLAGCGGGSSGGNTVGRPDSWTVRTQTMPKQTWEGGKSRLRIHVENSQSAVIKMEFYEKTTGDKEGRKIVVEQPVRQGESYFTVNLKPGTGGYFELGMPDAKSGATLNCTLDIDDKTIYKESSQLNGVLAPNEAFFLNVDFNDFTTGEAVSDD